MLLVGVGGCKGFILRFTKVPMMVLNIKLRFGSYATLPNSQIAQLANRQILFLSLSQTPFACFRRFLPAQKIRNRGFVIQPRVVGTKFIAPGVDTSVAKDIT